MVIYTGYSRAKPSLREVFLSTHSRTYNNIKFMYLFEQQRVGLDVDVALEGQSHASTGLQRSLERRLQQTDEKRARSTSVSAYKTNGTYIHNFIKYADDTFY